MLRISSARTCPWTFRTSCRVYDQDELLSKIKEQKRDEQPEFFPPVNSFYKHEDGEFTPYGDELWAHVAYLASHAQEDKAVDGDRLAKVGNSLVACFEARMLSLR